MTSSPFDSFGRSGHGNGARFAIGERIEVPPADELSGAVQAPPAPDAGDERRPGGQFAPGARTIQAAGGKAKRNKSSAIKKQLGAWSVHPRFEPYRAEITRHAKRLRKDVQRNVSGGLSSAVLDSLALLAAVDHVGALFVAELAAESGDPAMFAQASKLAAGARQHMLGALHVGAALAKARPQGTAEPVWFIEAKEAPARPVEAAEAPADASVHPSAAEGEEGRK